MNNKIKPTNIFIVLKTACVILASAFMFSCVSHPDVPENYTQEDKLPEIFPDYTDGILKFSKLLSTIITESKGLPIFDKSFK